MMAKFTRVAALALAIAPPLALAGPAYACSVKDDYRVPTNLELAGQAQAVLLGRVVGAHADAGKPYLGTIAVHPLAALKGDLPKGDIDLPGMLPPKPGFDVLSDPYNFASAHPLSYIGGCIRYIFPLGTTVLFFLDRKDGHWVPAGGPFSRWAEDALSPDAPWVRLTRLYLQAAALPDADSRALLEKQRDELAAQKDDPVEQLMAQDVARQLAGANEPWNRAIAREVGRELGREDESAQGGEENSVDASLDAMRGGAKGQ